jgi:hypothetical protein
MKIIPPIDVTTTNLTASNVTITETLWTAGTYTTGTERYVGTTLYRVIASPSTADNPTVGVNATPATWEVVGSINRFKMFDFKIGQKTSRASPISVTVDPGGVVNSVALLELAGANSARVRVSDPVAGTVYDQTRDLTDYTGLTNWYAYFFTPYSLKSDVFFNDLPAYVDANVLIDVSGPATVEIGETVIGQGRVIGSTAIDVQLGIEDFSRKERDEAGNITIVERRFSKLASFTVLLENNAVMPMFNTLAARRAVPTLYVGGDAFAETFIFGFYRDFMILRSGPVTSELAIEIEGLV